MDIFKELVDAVTTPYTIKDRRRVRDTIDIFTICAKNALKQEEYREFLDLVQSLIASIDIYRVTLKPQVTHNSEKIITFPINNN